MLIHVTQSGKQIPLDQIGDRHLLNIIKYLERKAKEGIVIKEGGGHPCEPGTFYYEEHTIYDAKALEKLSYCEYVGEAIKRGLDLH